MKIDFHKNRHPYRGRGENFGFSGITFFLLNLGIGIPEKLRKIIKKYVDRKNGFAFGQLLTKL